MIDALSLWIEQLWLHPIWSDPAFFDAALGVLFAWAFLAATVLSIPSEAAYLILTAHYPASLWLIWAVASLGNFFGGCTTFWMGHWLAGVKPMTVAPRVQAALARWGALALLGSSIPVMGDAMVLAAGYFRLPVWSCMGALLCGKAARYALLSSFAA